MRQIEVRVTISVPAESESALDDREVVEATLQRAAGMVSAFAAAARLTSESVEHARSGVIIEEPGLLPVLVSVAVVVDPTADALVPADEDLDAATDPGTR
jgi:hypothetical protein